MTRLSEWVDMQCRLVQHGGTVAVFRLKGPDETNYGTWPIGTEKLSDCIATTAAMVSEELPKGRHAFHVHAYDADGGEVAVMPFGVEGRSSGATSAAAEQLTLQKATSAAIFNANVMNEGLRKQVENLNSSIAELSAGNVELIDQIHKMAAENAARDIADMRKDAVNDAIITVCSAVKKNAEPLLGLLLAKWGPDAKKPALSAPSTPAAVPAAAPAPSPAPEPAPQAAAAPASPLEPNVEPATDQPTQTVTSERTDRPPATEREPTNGQAARRDPEPDHDHRGDPAHQATGNSADDRKRTAAGRKPRPASPGKASRRATNGARARP